MSKVGRFITDPKAGAYCQVILDSGDKLVVNHAKGGFKGGPLTIETTKWWGGGQRIASIDLDSPAGQAALGKLTAGQSALLAAALPNPFDRDPAKPGPGLRSQANRIAGMARASGAYIGCLEAEPSV